jgi:DNA repair protein RadB
VGSKSQFECDLDMAAEQRRIPTGCPSLDALLRGGFGRGEVTLVYGEAGTGKTTTVIQVATSAARMGLKVLYIDSDHSFTHQRFQQIARNESQAASELIMIFLPETFAEQRVLIESFQNYITPSVGLVIVDSMSSLYRAAFSNAESIFTLNRDLSRQLAYMGELSASTGISCIVTSQVHARLTPPLGDVEPVARRALFHFPRAILRLRHTPRQGVKEFVLERIEGSDMRGASCLVALKETGLEDVRA